MRPVLASLRACRAEILARWRGHVEVHWLLVRQRALQNVGEYLRRVVRVLQDLLTELENIASEDAMVRDLHAIQSGCSCIKPREVATKFDELWAPRAPGRNAAHAATRMSLSRCRYRLCAKYACRPM